MSTNENCAHRILFVYKKQDIKKANITKLNIEYIARKNIVFNYYNLGLKELHKIIISNKTQSVALLCHDNNSNLYNEDLSDTITITELTDIIEYPSKEN